MLHRWNWCALAIATATATSSTAHAGLSIPNKLWGEEYDARVSDVAKIAASIQNEPRALTIRNVSYPFSYGPVARPGSLAANIVNEEGAELEGRKDPNAAKYVGIAANTTFNTENDYLAYYDKIASFVPRPMSTDISDDTFGELRMTGFGFKIAQVRDAEQYGDTLAIVADRDVSRVCGRRVTADSLLENGDLYVVDFSDVAQWNDPSNPKKYVPNIIGFFCHNTRRSKVLPFAIHLVDQELTYTPFDNADEWKLAKMALNAAEINWQNMQHFVETHLMTSPVRVELMRTTAASHPVNALVQYHCRGDIALEAIAPVTLIAAGTVIDQAFAWGATGSMRFFKHQFDQKLSITRNFVVDAQERGIDTLPLSKYYKYASMYWDALGGFVSAYLRAYYCSDEDVQNDQELQNWVKACTSIPQLTDFPSFIDSIDELSDLVLHLIFSSSVRHHSMNGMVTWDTASIPYSMPSLWKPWPTRKLASGESLSIVDYNVPVSLTPSAIGAVLVFRREAKSPSATFSRAYTGAPFANETVVAESVGDFQAMMEYIESQVETDEQDEKWPYRILQPSRLPFTAWI
ncbi:TPA: hypothetical protein N0F65_004860 [Lagenidium giganteum]|uniref:Lipoxygenase domain-containing protein n=1 Tax=Lagenidium giganteum TaxID=4803 RepID=A0AAV2Z6X7_9STRA|nr:TPA: hypothetical protein N0F65_004860 [Lagenidium giganteum]